MHQKLICLIFLLLLQKSLSKKDQKNDKGENFQATNEWKEIKEGQKVPSGLHYRINLSTGKKEAKILTPEDQDESKRFTLQDDIDEGKRTVTTNEIEQLLKQVDKKNPENDMPKKFRTLDELKKDLADIELQSKSDMEILRELFKKFNEEVKKKQVNENVILGILQDLKYLGHQIDNGNEFYNLDGFRKIIYKQLNSTSITIKQETLKLFSILAQNNPKVKVHILETGGVTTLLRILNLEDNDLIKKSAITALSCTLRTFPYAQNKFIEIGGINIFTELFKTASIKLKLKIVTLLNDLIVERQKDSNNFENHEFIDIEQSLFDLGWCNLLNELLHDLLIIDVKDFDSIEKCLLAMKSMVNKCKSLYKNEVIVKLHEQYDILVKNEDADSEEYFKYLRNLTLELSINNKSNKDEL